MGKEVFTSPSVTGGGGDAHSCPYTYPDTSIGVFRAQLSASQNVSHLGLLPNMQALIQQVHSGRGESRFLMRFQVGPMLLGHEPVLA